MTAGARNLDTNNKNFFNSEERSEIANFKDLKNITMTNLLKDVTLSIDKFIKESI